MVRRDRNVPALDKESWPGIYRVGMGLLLFSALYMTVAAAAALPVFGSYREYRLAMGSAPLYSEMLFAMATGLTLAVATGGAIQRRRALLVFAIPAALLALAGNRGEILYPVAAAVAVYFTRGYKISAKALVAGAAVFFLFIPTVEQIRATGVAEADFDALSIRWTDPFVLNGFALRPLTFTVASLDESDEFGAGQTYLLPLRRIAGALTPFVDRPAYETTPFYDLRYGLPRQGYSVVAEAYYNFGVVGVMVLLFGIGAFLSLVGDRATGAASLAFAGAVMAVLINAIRNTWAFVPGQILEAGVFCLVGVMLTLLIGARRAAPNVKTYSFLTSRRRGRRASPASSSSN
jgi:oligosaccharide repeat unit polymerase